MIFRVWRRPAGHGTDERRSRIVDRQKLHKRDPPQVIQVLLEQAEDCVWRAVNVFNGEPSLLLKAKSEAENRH